jgi:hypothetical protein
MSMTHKSGQRVDKAFAAARPPGRASAKTAHAVTMASQKFIYVLSAPSAS